MSEIKDGAVCTIGDGDYDDGYDDAYDYWEDNRD